MRARVQRILAVEDDPDIQVILKMVLTKLGKVDVTIAGEGEKAIAAARGRPEAILLDVMLPDMSGFEIIKRLKAEASTASIPVIFLTARSMPAEIEEMKRLGALGYLAKPFDPMTLVAQINELLNPLGIALGG